MKKFNFWLGLFVLCGSEVFGGKGHKADGNFSLPVRSRVQVQEQAEAAFNQCGIEFMMQICPELVVELDEKTRQGIRELDMRGFDIGGLLKGQAMECFATALRSLSQLDWLNLSQCNIGSIDDNDMVPFAGALGSLVGLRSLSLNGCNLARLSHDAFSVFANGFEKLVLLQDLNLNYTIVTQFSDDHMEILAGALEKLVNVRRLSLVGIAFTKFSRLARQNFFDACRRFVNLQELCTGDNSLDRLGEDDKAFFERVLFVR